MSRTRIRPRDRLRVEWLVRRYGWGLDERRVDVVVSCFASDAELSIDQGSRTFSGLHAIRAFYDDALSEAPAEYFGVARVVQSTHTMSSVDLTRVGPEVRGVTRGFAVLVGPEPKGAAGHTTLRGLRYEDRLVRTRSGWLIQERRHSALWECRAVAADISRSRASDRL